MNLRRERLLRGRVSRLPIPFGLPELILAIVVLVTEFFVSEESLTPASVATAVVGVVLVATAARWPLTTAMLSVPFVVASSYLAGDTGTYSIFFIVIIIEVVTAGGLAGVGLMMVPAHAGASTIDFSARSFDTDPTVMLVILVMLGTGYLIGRNRLSQEIRDADLRESLARSQRNQRLALARDLHDSVATSLTSVVMRSEALQLTAPDDADAAVRDGLEDISRTSRAALEQLRTMLRLLNSESDDSDDTGEQPDPPTVRASLDATSQELRAHRLKVRTRIALGHSDDPDVDRETLARILTEMTSNAVKHSPDRAEVLLTCSRDARTVRVTMVNPVKPGSADSDPVLTSHLGIGSMTARAQAAGGVLDAGLSEDRIWQTAVTLPIVECAD